MIDRLPKFYDEESETFVIFFLLIKKIFKKIFFNVEHFRRSENRPDFRRRSRQPESYIQSN
jgi:hypothetical protein